MNRVEFCKTRRRRPDVPAGIAASGSSSVAPRCPVGGPLSRLRHTMPTILPYCICLHRKSTYTHTYTHACTYIHTRSTREGNIDLALHRQGGQRIPFKDHVSRTAVYRDYGPSEEVEGLEAFDSRVLSCGVRGTNSREIEDSSLRRRRGRRREPRDVTSSREATTVP